jgi:NADH-quinone oxidoreductase subunit G
MVARALPGARFLSALRRGNVHGALDMGLAPGVLPGRVTLDEGREWFTRAWGSVPGQRGRDAAGILAASSEDPSEGTRVRSLVLLGADPLSDFPDAGLARRALDGAEFVVAVVSAPGTSTEAADVVLPAAEAHERPGTTTNLEGRVSRLGQKLVPPGQAWPDWMIAGELAVHLGHDLGFDSVGTVWDEIERVAVSHRGITRAVLDAHGAADGVVAPLSLSKVSLARRNAPLDPVAVPGVESVERQGASLQAGLAASPNAAADGPEAAAPSDADLSRPAVLSGPGEFAVPHVAPADGYSVRLVASRVLYDGGTAVATVSTLAGLVAPGALRANPHDLDDLGVPSGGQVRLRSATASAVVPVEPDPSLPRKVVAADFNVPLGDGTVADLIDRAFPVVDLRMESL